jgi:hypothetical protein
MVITEDTIPGDSTRSNSNRSRAIIGDVGDFDPRNVQWNIFSEKLNQFFLANHISEEEKAAVLLTKLSNEVYSIISDLFYPEKIYSKSYDEITEKLNQYYGISVAVFRERETFYKLEQHDGESINEWNCRIKKTASTCKFGTILQGVLRDIFITGLHQGPIKEKLMEEDEDITYDVAVTKALKKETNMNKSQVNYVKKNTPQMSNRSRYQGVQEKQSNNEDRRLKCVVCGKGNHTAEFCRLKNAICFNCNQKGHTRNMCRQPRSHNNNNFIEIQDSDEAEGALGINKILSRNFHQPFIVHVNINNQHLAMELDTGSPISAISDNLYKNLFSSEHLEPATLNLKTYTGTTINTLGKIRITIEVNDVKASFDLYVIVNGGPPLLGRDFIKRFQIPIGINNINMKKNLNSILEENHELFDDQPGKFKLKKVKLYLQENAIPVYRKPRPLPLVMKIEVEKELERLEKAGIITPCEITDWGSPLVPVKKQDGSMRLCGDYKVTLNKYLMPHRFPIPRVEDVFRKLQGGKQFSSIDLKEAYTQLELDDESKLLCAWSTHKGCYKMESMPYGILPATSIFQNFMNQLFDKMDGIAIYVDDITITGKDEDEHLQNLAKVFGILKNAGLKLKKKKCKFMCDDMQLLGHIINEQGVKKMQSKVEQILKLEAPTNTKEVQSMMGVITYYAKFIPKMATIMNPIYCLSRKNAEFVWTRECASALCQIKEIINEDSQLAHFIPGCETILETDASNVGVSAVLFQMQENRKRPIQFSSRTLSKAELNYSVTDKEGLAIIFGLNKFYEYLYGYPKFKICTDHKPIVSIFGENNPIPHVISPRRLRWANFLSAFDYEIDYIKGEDNMFADHLSRHPVTTPEDQSKEEEFSSVNALFQNQHIDKKLICEEVQKCLILQEVKENIKNNWKHKGSSEMQAFYKVRNTLYIEDDCVMFDHRLVVPSTLRLKILEEMHKTHLGIVKMKSLARTYFWWPGITEDIEQMINKCQHCYLARPNPQKITKEKWPSSDIPWERVHVDFFMYQRQNYLLLVDAFSKWPEVFKMISTTASSTISRLKDVFSRFGNPKVLVSDNGPQFTSAQFSDYMKQAGIVHITSPVGHPQSNGQAECFVKNVKAALEKNQQSNNNQTEDILNDYLFYYRNSQHVGTNKSPAELMFNRKLRMKFDVLTEKIRPREQIQAENKSSRSFKTNDDVIVKDFSQKNKERWMKGNVTKQVGRNVYLVKVGNNIWKRHTNQMYKIKASVEKQGHLVEADRQIRYYKRIPVSTPTPTVPVENDAEFVSQQPNVMASTSRPQRNKKMPKTFDDFIVRGK